MSQPAVSLGWSTLIALGCKAIFQNTKGIVYFSGLSVQFSSMIDHFLISLVSCEVDEGYSVSLPIVLEE